MTSSDPPPDVPTDLQDERWSVRKRNAILEAATEVFLRNGYLGDAPLTAAHLNWLVMRFG